MATLVAQRYPEKKLSLFAYGPYQPPPQRAKPHPNLLIQYAYHVAWDWDPAAAPAALMADYVQAGFGPAAPVGLRHYERLARQGFALAYLWIRYNVENRSFVPLEPMRAFAASPGAKG